MFPAQIKLVLVSTAIVGSIVMLAFDGSRSATVYYQTVPEFNASVAGSALPTRDVRLTGYVVEGSIVRNAGEPLVFLMRDKEKTTSMRVSYDDIVPDTFKDGAEVVVEGRPGANGAFEANLLLAKCPSKYEAEDGEKSRY